MNTRRKKLLLRVLIVGAGAVLPFVGFFVFNGLVLANNGQVTTGTEKVVASKKLTGRIKILAWNLAKCFVYEGGFRFAEENSVRDRLARIARLLRRENADLVFLSEVLTECTPCDVNQVRYLAREGGYAHWAFGENFNFGLPFYRIVSGNAILAKFAFEGVENQDLAGRRPFWITKNNRRILWCRTSIADEDILLGAMHLDSFDLVNNARQMRQVLEHAGTKACVLAGDFNADPATESMQSLMAAQRFSGALHGQATFPANDPARRIDYVFGPRTWRLIEHRVVDDENSDHRPVISVYALR